MPEDTQQQQGSQSTGSKDEGQTPSGLQPEKEPAKSDGALPENVKERTRKEFEKLKNSNKELKQKLDKLQQTQHPNVLDAYKAKSIDDQAKRAISKNQQNITDQYSNKEIQQLNESFPGIVDKDGYVDPKALNSALAQVRNAEQIARRAEQRVAEYEITNQTKELHSQYPEVDPNSDQFNMDAYELVKKELLDQLMTTGKQDAIKAANKVSKYFRQNKKSKKSDSKKETARRNATVSVGQSGRSAASKNSYSHDELVELSRKGDKRAISERLKAAGY